METHLIDTPCMTIDQFVEYYNSHNFKGQMFDKDGKFNHNYNNYKKTGLIAKIFEDHWKDYYLLNKDKVDKYRPNADYEINKVIDCFNQNCKCQYLNVQKREFVHVQKWEYTYARFWSEIMEESESKIPLVRYDLPFMINT